jgi:alpha-1,3/alpha-1,6-mannosyltransferase
VRVRGNTLVPATLFGRFAILCAILRQLHLVLHIALFTAELSNLRPTAFFVDQLSAAIPLLRFLQPRPRIIFYCHFPDKLLARRGGLLKALYRAPFDWLESWSTVDITAADATGDAKPLWENTKTLLSINRFEKKKDVGLAVKAFAGLSPSERKNARLIVAGGYDSRVPENLATYTELCQLADSLNLKHATADSADAARRLSADISVIFLHSVPSDFKALLLSTSRLLVYTPRNEHFGIVPLEAMLAGTPVLAANEGGPTETVISGQTGWLRDVSKVQDWTEVMRIALEDGDGEQRLKEMGKWGRERVVAEFSKEKMAETLESEILTMIKRQVRPPLTPFAAVLLIVVFMGALSVSSLYLAIAQDRVGRESRF